MPLAPPIAIDYATAPGNAHATIDGARAKEAAPNAEIKLASYIINLSLPFEAAKYRDELAVCQYIYPNAAILLVGLQTGNEQTNISELQQLAGSRDILIIPNSDSLGQDAQLRVLRYKKLTAMLFEQLRIAIQQYEHTPMGLALADLAARARRESPDAAFILVSETLNLIEGLQQTDHGLKLQAIANFHETTKDNINYAFIYQSATRRSILSICLTGLCTVLIAALIGAVCGGVCGGLGFLIAGPIGGTVGMIAGIAFSFWLADLATAKFKSTPHFTGSFSFFKTPIGKSIDKVVSCATEATEPSGLLSVATSGNENGRDHDDGSLVSAVNVALMS